jgi:hypothetical protein
MLEAKCREFYSHCYLSKNFALINIESIKEKCIYIENNNEFFVALVHDEEDHD